MREEPELPNFEPIDSPARSPEEGPQEEIGDPTGIPTLGCSAYGKSQRQHHRHKVSFGEKQLPPGV